MKKYDRLKGLMFHRLKEEIIISIFGNVSLILLDILTQKNCNIFYYILVGGGDNYRKYWSNFLQDTDVLVFVVDAAAPDLLLIAGQEVKNLLGDERLTNVPLLILANKQVNIFFAVLKGNIEMFELRELRLKICPWLGCSSKSHFRIISNKQYLNI